MENEPNQLASEARKKLEELIRQLFASDILDSNKKIEKTINNQMDELKKSINHTDQDSEKRMKKLDEALKKYTNDNDLDIKAIIVSITEIRNNLAELESTCLDQYQNVMERINVNQQQTLSKNHKILIIMNNELKIIRRLYSEHDNNRQVSVEKILMEFDCIKHDNKDRLKEIMIEINNEFNNNSKYILKNIVMTDIIVIMQIIIIIVLCIKIF